MTQLKPLFPPSPWRSVGLWMSAAIVVLMGLNAVRAYLDPQAFAIYLGLPLTDRANIGFVHVYGLRALFLALFALILILRRDLATLKWYALSAVVMPLGDAALVAQAHGVSPTVYRHLAIAAYLLATAALLHGWNRRHSASAALDTAAG